MRRSRQLLASILLATSVASVDHALAAPIPYSLTHDFQSPGTARQTGTRLGSSVAIGGTLIAVGSPFDDIGGQDSGVVWIHEASSGALLHRLDNPLPFPTAYFGWSVAVSGNLVVVGAPDDNTGAKDAGIAYVYDLTSATPSVPVVTLPNPNPSENDRFGYSVAISGTDVVVGTPEGDSGIANSGCVYVFDLASATPAMAVRQIHHPNQSGENFGHAVALDGTMLVVGARQKSAGPDISRAYVYDLDSATPSLPQLTLQDASPSSNEQFGYSVAIAGDRIVVSAPWDDTFGADSGIAYAYDLTSPVPEEPVTILSQPSPAAGDLFGISVTLSGNLAVVGAHLDDMGAVNSGVICLFDLSSGTPGVATLSIGNPGPDSNDEFGKAVALSGTRLLVGAAGDDTGADTVGSAYVFELSSGSLQSPVITLNNPSPSSNEEFGAATAISGNIVVIGSPRDDKGASNAGVVAVYDLASPDPTEPVVIIDNPTPSTNDYFGAAVAASGNLVAVGAIKDYSGASNAGAVYIYDVLSSAPGTPLLVVSNPSPQSQDEFGGALAMSGDLLVVGAHKKDIGAEDAGAAYVFDLTSLTPGVPVQVIHNPESAIGDWFGYSVGVSGERVVVGAPNDDAGASNAGRAYVFDLASATPGIPLVVFANPAPGVGDEFGFSVAISGPNVVIGSRKDDNVAPDAGDVMVYDLTSATPGTPVANLNRLDAEEGDLFGASVAISGSRIVAGAPASDRLGSDGGAAYVYELNSATGTVPADLLESSIEKAGDWFGEAVAIDGTNIMVGAPEADGTTHNKGAAYLFDPDPPSPELQVEQPPGNGLLGGAASIHFGNAPVGVAGPSQTVVVRNIGTDFLEIQAVSITGANPADFSMSAPSLPVILAVDDSILIEVSFSPIGSGSRVGTLSIESNAGSGSPFEITLAGQGLSAGEDTDGDGLNDVVELQLESLGFDWQVNDEERLAILQWGANAEGLYTGEQLQEMEPATPLISRNPVDGRFKLTIAVKKSVDLADFSLYPMAAPETAINGQGRLEFHFTPADPAAFFRLEPR